MAPNGFPWHLPCPAPPCPALPRSSLPSPVEPMWPTQGSIEGGGSEWQPAAVPAVSHAAWLAGTRCGRGPAERPRHAGQPGPALQPHRPPAHPGPCLPGPPAWTPGRPRSRLPLPGTTTTCMPHEPPTLCLLHSVPNMTTMNLWHWCCSSFVGCCVHAPCFHATFLRLLLPIAQGCFCAMDQSQASAT